jgi:hypothetical protein
MMHVPFISPYFITRLSGAQESWQLGTRALTKTANMKTQLHTPSKSSVDKQYK